MDLEYNKVYSHLLYTEKNKHSLLPIHYAISSDKKETLDILEYLLSLDRNDQNYRTTLEITNEDKTLEIEPLTFILKKQKHLNSSHLFNKTKKLLEYGFSIPTGAVVKKYEGDGLMKIIKDYLEEEFIKKSNQLSFINDNTSNYYYCPCNETEDPNKGIDLLEETPIKITDEDHFK